MDEKSGLSRKERAILQDDGATGIGQDNNYFKMWKYRIKFKVRLTIVDTILLLKNRSWMEIDPILHESCIDDLRVLRALCDDVLNEIGIDKGGTE